MDSGRQLVALTRDDSVDRFRWKAKWTVRAEQIAGPGIGVVRFAGSPIIDENRLYCAWTRTVGTRSLVSITALNLIGVPLWSRNVLDLTNDTTDRMLTPAGGNIIITSDAGSIVAVNAETGRPAWARRYPAKAVRSPVSELTPTVRSSHPGTFSAGRFFVAPAENVPG